MIVTDNSKQFKAIGVLKGIIVKNKRGKLLLKANDKYYPISFNKYRYKIFNNQINENYQKFIIKFKNTTCNKDKKMYYDVLYKFYKGFKDLLKNNEDKIFLKSYTINRHAF